MSHRRRNAEDLRGAARLAVAATRGVVDIVEEMHLVIGGGPSFLGRPLAGPTRLATAFGYAAIRGVTAGVGVALDQSLAALAPLLGSSEAGPQRDLGRSVLNGVLGDTLEATGNSLAIEMSLRRGGRSLPMEAEALRAALPEPGGKLLVLVHGSCMNDRQWLRRGHDHGAELARELGFSPLYLHYNSGLHISQNGARLAALLEQLVAAWPCPVEEVTLLGHSMGGLVSRSACHHGERAGHKWRGLLRTLVCLGSPHHGAPLERGGNWVDILLGVFAPSRPLGRLGRLRSAGVTDLRFGNVLDAHWQGRDRFAYGGDERTPLPLPADVRCFAVAAELARRPRARAIGDGLVPVASALGVHARPELTLAFPEEHQRLIRRAGHLDLLDHPEVYAALRQWLAPTAAQSG